MDKSSKQTGDGVIDYLIITSVVASLGIAGLQNFGGEVKTQTIDLLQQINGSQNSAKPCSLSLPQAKPNIVFDSRSQRYRNKKTGRYVKIPRTSRC